MSVKKAFKFRRSMLIFFPGIFLILATEELTANAASEEIISRMQSGQFEEMLGNILAGRGGQHMGGEDLNRYRDPGLRYRNPSGPYEDDWEDVQYNNFTEDDRDYSQIYEEGEEDNDDYTEIRVVPASTDLKSPL